MQDFILGNTYNFDTYLSSIGSTTEAEVLGIVDYETAALFNDIEALHANIFPNLPDGTSNDFRSYNYVLFKSKNGTRSAYGLPWIDKTTIQLVESKTLYVTIPNTSSDEIEQIRKSLVAIGKTPSNMDLR